MLEEGRFRSAGELAEAEGLTRSFVNRLLRLTLLAPDVQEAILDGRQAKGMQLDELTRTTPSGWGEQRVVLYASSVQRSRVEARSDRASLSPKKQA